MKYDIAIAHRVCPVLAKTAVHFTDKFKMVQATTDSLFQAITGLKVKLFVILDGSSEAYEDLFKSKFSNMQGVDLEVVRTPAIGNHPTYAKQVDLLSAVENDAEYLYFSEDDYIYARNAFKAMMDFLGNKGVDFVTPLDHPDRYSLPLIPERRRVEIRVSSFCHWREVGTTCCTFMTKSTTFRKAKRRISTYGEGLSDIELWIGLTKDCVFSPSATIGAALRYLLGLRKTEYGLEFMVLSVWRHFKWRLFFFKRYRLWGPMPSLAIHLCKPSLPPLFEAGIANTSNC